MPATSARIQFGAVPQILARIQYKHRHNTLTRFTSRTQAFRACKQPNLSLQGSHCHTWSTVQVTATSDSTVPVQADVVLKSGKCRCKFDGGGSAGTDVVARDVQIHLGGLPLSTVMSIGSHGCLPAHGPLQQQTLVGRRASFCRKSCAGQAGKCSKVMGVELLQKLCTYTTLVHHACLIGAHGICCCHQATWMWVVASLHTHVLHL